MCVWGETAPFPVPSLTSMVLFYEDGSPFSRPRIQTWAVKGAKGNVEPGRSGLEFDHVHPSMTAELIFALAVF